MRFHLDPLTRLLIKGAPAGAGTSSGTPVLLMYHGTPDQRNRPSYPYSLRACDFAQHLDLLREWGWSTICVRDLAGPKALEGKTIAITFDDGLADNYRGAFHALQKRGMCATWFVVSDLIGKDARWLSGHSGGSALLTGPQLREMHTSGMEIGSHSCSHADLTILDAVALRREVIDSKRRVEDLLGEAVGSFAYPFGRLNGAVVEEVRKAEYRFACTVQPGRYSAALDPMLIPRLTIFSSATIGIFARGLCFVDNDVSWMTGAKYAARRLAARLTAFQDGTRA